MESDLNIVIKSTDYKQYYLIMNFIIQNITAISVLAPFAVNDYTWVYIFFVLKMFEMR